MNQNLFIDNKYQFINSFAESSREYFHKSLKNFVDHSIKVCEKGNKILSEELSNTVSSWSESYWGVNNLPGESKTVFRNIEKNCLDFIQARNDLNCDTINSAKKQSEDILNYDYKDDFKKFMNSCKFIEKRTFNNFMDFANYFNSFFPKNYFYNNTKNSNNNHKDFKKD